jgi:kynureninase
VAEFFDAQGLTVEALRARSLSQTRRVMDLLLAAGADVRTPLADAARGGFVSVRFADAAARCDALRARGIFVDHRGALLRVGPAPYTTDDEIDRGVEAVLSAGGSCG